MQQRLFALGGTDESPGAARDGLVRKARDRRTALRTLRGQCERERAVRPLLRDDAHDLRYHVSRPPHDHRVADADVLAAHLVLVVQRGVGHRHAADEHGLEPCHRRDRAGAPDLDVDADHLGCHFLGGELVRDREARRPRHETEPLLQREVVELVDDAVDLEGQPVAARAHPPVIVEQPGDAAHDGAFPGHRQAELRQQQQQRLVGGGRCDRSPAHVADAVGVEGQAAAGGYPRVELTQAAGGGIARIDERLLAPGGLTRVQRLEVASHHQHLSAHLDERRDCISRESQRDRADGAQIGGHVFARGTVAAGRADREAPVLVAQTHGQAVELGLHRVLDFLDSQGVPHAPVEGLDLVVGERIVEREHRQAVRHRLEGGGRDAADSLRRRLRRHQRRKPLLQCLQLAEQVVVLGIADRGSIENVVAMIVRGEFAPEIGGARDSGDGHASVGFRGGRCGHHRMARALADGRFSHRTAPARAGCPARCGPRAVPLPCCAPDRGWH